MSVELIDKIKPKNNGNFALVDAADVEMPDGTRLSEYEPEVNLTEEQIAALKGKDGKDGVDGKTPVKGTDYWTAADKLEIASELYVQISSLFVPVTQEEYDAMVAAGTVDPNKYYMIVG